MQKKTVSAKFDTTLVAQLDGIAKTRGCSRTAVMESCLSIVLENSPEALTSDPMSSVIDARLERMEQAIITMSQQRSPVDDELTTAITSLNRAVDQLNKLFVNQGELVNKVSNNLLKGQHKMLTDFIAADAESRSQLKEALTYIAATVSKERGLEFSELRERIDTALRLQDQL